MAHPPSVPALNTFTAAGLLGGILIAGIILDVRILRRVIPRMAAVMRRMRSIGSKPWSWRQASLIGWFILAVYSLLPLAIPPVKGSQTPPGGGGARIVTQTLVVPLAVLGITLAHVKRRHASWKKGFGIRREDVPRQIGQGLRGYLAAMPPFAGASWLYYVVLRQMDYPIQTQDAVRLLFDPHQPGWLHAYVAVAAVTMAPFGEELFFRGVLLPPAARTLGPGTAVAAISLLFALLHFHIPSLVPLWVIAAAFSVAYAWSGSLVVPIVMHVLFNAVNLAVLFLLRQTLPLGL